MKNLFLEQEQLPEPLSKEELTLLFRKNPNQDPEVLEKILVHNLRLVANRIYKRFSYGFDIEELFAVGCYGLLKAVRTFDLSKNVQFTTYSARCIDNEILCYIHKNTQDARLVSLEQNKYVDHEGNEMRWIDFISESTAIDPFEDIEKKEKNHYIMEAIAKLSLKEQKVILLRYGFVNDMCISQKEVGRKLNLSQCQVGRIEKMARKKLEVIFAKYTGLFPTGERMQEQDEAKVLKK